MHLWECAFAREERAQHFRYCGGYVGTQMRAWIDSVHQHRLREARS